MSHRKLTRSPLFAAAFALVFAAGCATTPETKPDTTATTGEEVTVATAPEEKPAPKEAAAAEPTQVPARPLQQPEPMKLVLLADPQKPIVTFRLTFRAGSVDDPKGKEGLTALTAEVMAEGGTKELSSSQLLEALFPIAGEVEVNTDKEFTAFVGRVHQDNLPRFFDIFSDVLLEPRFDEKEFARIRSDFVNNIRNNLRGQDDELLGKVALDAMIYEGTPYAHYVGGTVQGLEAITLEDVKAHWKNVFTQDRLVIGLAGNVTPELQKQVQAKFAELPKTGAPLFQPQALQLHTGRAWILPKPVLSTAISMGYAFPLRRGDPDFFPVAAALSYLGEHRQFNGVLFNELREQRGLNYGNYAYPEHFIQEGWGTYALTNTGRAIQDFSIWIRPVESQNAMFATRGAVYFLDRLVNEGIPADKWELTRGFLLGYTRLWEQTDSRRLGYAIDALYYGTPNYLEQYRTALKSMTREQIQAAVKKHLSSNKLNYVYVAPDGAALQKLLVDQPPTPMEYPTPKSEKVLAEDKKIAGLRVPVNPALIEVKQVDQFMER